MLFIAIEIAMMLLFLLCLAHAVKIYDKNKKKLLLLVLAFIYAILFENFNMLLSKGNEGSYFYNPDFNLWIFNVPLFVALAWATLLYTAMLLSDMLKLKTLAKPFMDALHVIVIDMTLDIVAVRQGLWSWIGYSQNQGWFGVPADNFIGWLLVTFTFSFLFRYISRTDDDMINKTTRTEYYFLLPAFAYLAMLVMFSLVNLAEDVMKLTKAEELFMFWAIVIFFAAMLKKPDRVDVHPEKPEPFGIFTIIFVRLLFFSYVMWSFVFTKVYEESVIVVIMLIFTIIAEVLIYHSAFGHVGGKISFGEKEMEHF
jgi:uncharacterized membrane protein